LSRLLAISLLQLDRDCPGNRSRLWTTTREVDEMSKLAPIHPGQVLMEDFIAPLGITRNKVAVAVGVPPRRINEIVHGKRRITADSALRLARYFGTSELFWTNLQNRYDLEMEKDALVPSSGMPILTCASLRPSLDSRSRSDARMCSETSHSGTGS
jgi:addiction module HigA family antidote